MRDYAKVSPLFWTRGSGKKLRGDPDAQVLALYLVTCPSANMIGIYYVPFVAIAHETGIGASRTAEAFQRLADSGFAFYDESAELVWVPNMASYQIGDELRGADKRRAGVVAEIEKVGRHPFVRAFWNQYGEAYALGACPMDTPPKGAPESDGVGLTPPSEQAPCKPLASPSEAKTSQKRRTGTGTGTGTGEGGSEGALFEIGGPVSVEAPAIYLDALGEAIGANVSVDISPTDMNRLIGVLNAYRQNGLGAREAIDRLGGDVRRWVRTVKAAGEERYTNGWAVRRFIEWVAANTSPASARPLAKMDQPVDVLEPEELAAAMAELRAKSPLKSDLPPELQGILDPAKESA